jgi:DNA-binding CsgD family transcriptional regulator
MPGARLGRHSHPPGAGPRPAELPAGADAELGEYLAQVPLDRARAEEQLAADLRIRKPLTGQPGDLRLLRGELAGRLDRPLPHGLAGGEQLAPGALGEPRDPHRGQHFVGSAELLPRVHPAVLTAQPFSVEQVCAGQFYPDAGAAEPLDGLAVQTLRGLGYLLKEKVGDLREFTDAVRRVAGGGSVLDPDVVSRLVGRKRMASPVDGLTPREREVLGLIAKGRSNAGIARELVVTVAAVERHVTSIFDKLGLHRSAEAHRRVLAVLTYLRA